MTVKEYQNKLKTLTVGRYYFVHHKNNGWQTMRCGKKWSESKSKCLIHEICYSTTGHEIDVELFVREYDAIGESIPFNDELKLYHDNKTLIDALLN